MNVSTLLTAAALAAAASSDTHRPGTVFDAHVNAKAVHARASGPAREQDRPAYVPLPAGGLLLVRRGRQRRPSQPKASAHG